MGGEREKEKWKKGGVGGVRAEGGGGRKAECGGVGGVGDVGGERERGKNGGRAAWAWVAKERGKNGGRGRGGRKRRVRN
ncbi:hypothetical protein TIFTF001_042498 [Ficus carica]|uniref:Uncharacterized protein n=1 Tax=Ficus carica TaxID=3494 RepID=A0AA88AA54_FICCA|nr:hypothetical protein TIFTF001_042498 [Ficus carica]